LPRPWDLNRTLTSCTHCAVGCQQFADVRYGKLLRTMLVEEDQISDGWLCDRGRYNVGFYESPDRLAQPLYRKNGALVQIGWDDAFILWSHAIRKAIAARGPASVGAIGGGRLTNEEAFALQHIFRRLGVNNLDWRAGSQRQATPGAKGAPLAAIDSAEVIVIAGESPAERAPVFWLRLHKAALRNGARIVRESGPQAARSAAGDATRVALVWDGIDLAVGRSYAQAFADVGELATFITSEQSNARGAEAMGMLPRSGPGYAPVQPGDDTAAMLDRARSGALDVLSIFGANPVRNGLDSAAASEALAKTPFVVVSELFMTETASMASLILPAKGAFEKYGTTTNLAGDLLPVNASLQAPEFVRSDFEMLCGLADQLEVAMPSFEEIDGAVVAHVAKAPQDFTLGDERFAGAAVGLAKRNGQAPILSGGGTWRHDPWLAEMRASGAAR